MTLRLSLDGGMTWPCSLLLDHYHGMGYSCMAMLDPETLGILYESSQGCEIFQAIPLRTLYETRKNR
jgi:sialidase-1